MDTLLENIDKLHTTAKGLERMQRNLEIDEDIVTWLKSRINQNVMMLRKGKNLYISFDRYTFTINANTYTIITAHKNHDY